MEKQLERIVNTLEIIGVILMVLTIVQMCSPSCATSKVMEVRIVESECEK